ncbi:MAG TPA: glutamate 5-kinase, partial [Luteimonas sp.]|nr:glutamate 5-kinase [Luteimonas sp.]
YDADPRQHPDARPVEMVSKLTPALLAAAGGSGSAVGTGGMRTKLEAAQRASAAGVATVLFNGTRADVLEGLAGDRLRGTRIHALRSRVAVRKHWLQNAPAEPGGIFVDAGAASALVEKGASLLPGGVVAVEGEFRRGDMVEVLLRDGQGSARVARGVSQYSAADIRRIARRHSREIEQVLGYSYGGNVIHRDDLMLV